MKSLKSEVEEARKTSKDLEKKYTEAAEDLDTKKSELEEAKKQNRELERKMQELLQGKFTYFESDGGSNRMDWDGMNWIGLDQQRTSRDRLNPVRPDRLS